jgi:hypothetical protein
MRVRRCPVGVHARYETAYFEIFLLREGGAGPKNEIPPQKSTFLEPPSKKLARVESVTDGCRGGATDGGGGAFVSVSALWLLSDVHIREVVCLEALYNFNYLCQLVVPHRWD